MDHFKEAEEGGGLPRDGEAIDELILKIHQWKRACFAIVLLAVLGNLWCLWRLWEAHEGHSKEISGWLEIQESTQAELAEMTENCRASERTTGKALKECRKDLSSMKREHSSLLRTENLFNELQRQARFSGAIVSEPPGCDRYCDQRSFEFELINKQSGEKHKGLVWNFK